LHQSGKVFQWRRALEGQLHRHMILAT
jgi:hypothetical protein